MQLYHPIHLVSDTSLFNYVTRLAAKTGSQKSEGLKFHSLLHVPRLTIRLGCSGGRRAPLLAAAITVLCAALPGPQWSVPRPGIWSAADSHSTVA